MLPQSALLVGGKSQTQRDEQGDGIQCVRNDGECATEAVPDGVEERSLQKFSLKLEDMVSNTPSRSADAFRAFFRRSRPSNPQTRTSHQKSNSQCSLTRQSSVFEDDSHNKPLHGVYGLLARHIEVPQSVWEALQPKPPITGSRQPIVDIMGAPEATTMSAEPRPRPSIFGLPLLHPYSRLAVAWNCAMLLFDLSFTAFWVPLNVGFCFKSYGNLDRPCTRSDLAGGIIYVINWILGFQVGAVATSGSEKLVVLDGMSVTWMYVHHGKFVMDSLAAVPFFVLVTTIASAHSPVGPGRRLWSLLSLLRLVRLLLLLNTVKVVYQGSLSGPYQMSWVAQRISVPLMYLIILGYQFLVVVNLSASLMVLLATYYGSSGLPTWYDSLKWVDFEAASAPQIWLNAAYWVVTVLTTTGQGQAPRRVGEQIVSNICAVYGMVFSGLVVGLVGEAIMRASGDAASVLRSRRNVGRATAWASKRHLQPNLTRELQVFFAESGVPNGGLSKEASYIDAMPNSLRREVLKHIVGGLLQEVHIFRGVDPELRDLLASMFRPVDVPPDHDLCRQGTPADRLWVVERGSVVALRHKEAGAHPTTGMTCLLGETVLLHGVMEAAALRPWTLRTTTSCHLWELHLIDLERVLRVDRSLEATALQYVKSRLIGKLNGDPEPDSKWCELVVLLGRTLKHPAMLDCAKDNLEALDKARVDDGSLPLLLSSWLEVGIATSLELGPGPKRGLVTMSLLLARQSNCTVGPAAAINPYGSAFHYPLAVTSPAIMSRYGSGRAGGGGGGGAGSGGGSNLTVRRPHSGGGGGGGLPGSPRTLLPTVSPAMLMRQTSGGGCDGTNITSRPPLVGDELLQDLRLSLGAGADGGGGSENDSTGCVPAGGPPFVGKSSRSFSYRAAGDPSSATPTAAAAAGGIGATPSATLSLPQVALPGLGGNTSCGGGSSSGGGGALVGRTAPSLSRFAAAAAAVAVAASMGIGSRRANPRTSISEDGFATAGYKATGGDGRSAPPTGAVDSEADTGRAHVGVHAHIAATAAVPDLGVETDRLSFIAHTTFAYMLVDAGGTPIPAHHHQYQQHQQHQQHQYLLRQQQQQPQGGRSLLQQLSESSLAARVRDGSLESLSLGAGAAAPATESALRFTPSSPLSPPLLPSPQGFMLRRSQSSLHMPSASIPAPPDSGSPRLQCSPRFGGGSGAAGMAAAVGDVAANAVATVAAPFLLARSSIAGSGGGDKGSPKAYSAGGCNPGAGGIAAAAGVASLVHGASGAAWPSTRLARTRSAVYLPLVPEEESVMRCSSDGGSGAAAAAGSGGGVSGVDGGSPPAGGTAQATAGPAEVGNGPASPSAAADPSVRSAAEAPGAAVPMVDGSGDGANVGSRSSARSMVRRRGVSRSRSASMLRLTPPLSPPPSVEAAAAAAAAAAPNLRQGRKKHAVSGGGGFGGGVYAIDSINFPKIPNANPAAITAAEPAADDGATPKKGGGLQPPPQLQQQCSDGTSSPQQQKQQPLRPAYPRSAVTPLPAAAVAVAGSSGGEVSFAAASDRLSQPPAPFPDRVSKLRVRTSAGILLASGRSSSFGNCDSASASASQVALPHSPSAAAAAASAAAAPAAAGGGGGPCPAPTLCPTCGKCSCAACRTRAMATALAMEQDAAAVLAAAAARPPPLPYAVHSWSLGPSTARAGGVTVVPRLPLELARGTACGAGTVYGNGGPGVARAPAEGMASWARNASVGVGGASGLRGPETWRRQASAALDLSMSSIPLALC